MTRNAGDLAAITRSMIELQQVLGSFFGTVTQYCGYIEKGLHPLDGSTLVGPVDHGTLVEDAMHVVESDLSRIYDLFAALCPVFEEVRHEFVGEPPAGACTPQGALGAASVHDLCWEAARIVVESEITRGDFEEVWRLGGLQPADPAGPRPDHEGSILNVGRLLSQITPALDSIEWLASLRHEGAIACRRLKATPPLQAVECVDQGQVSNPLPDPVEEQRVPQTFEDVLNRDDLSPEQKRILKLLRRNSKLRTQDSIHAAVRYAEDRSVSFTKRSLKDLQNQGLVAKTGGCYRLAPELRKATKS